MGRPVTKPRREDGSVYLGAMIPAELYTALLCKAKREHTTLATVTRQGLAFFLDQSVPNGTPPPVVAPAANGPEPAGAGTDGTDGTDRVLTTTTGREQDREPGTGPALNYDRPGTGPTAGERPALKPRVGGPAPQEPPTAAGTAE